MLDYLFQYCNTVRQTEVLKAVIDYGSNRKAAKKMGCTNQAVDRIIVALKQKASVQGISPEHDMCLIVLHKQHGEIERHRCDIGMLT